MTDHTQGLVDVTNGSVVVIGHDTDWTLGTPPNARKGDDFVRIGDARTYKILLVELIDPNTDRITLAEPYQGGTGTNVAYAITQNLQAAPGDTTGNRTGTGPPGRGGTITVSNTVTLPPGQDAEFVEQPGSTENDRIYELRTPRGDEGVAGSQIYTGLGAPDPSLGVDGDFYIDETPNALQLYGPKAAGDWGPPSDMQGAKGDPGESALPMFPNELTANTAVAVGYMYPINSTGGSFTITMSGATRGDKIGFFDATSTISNNPVDIVDALGNNFRQRPGPLTIIEDKVAFVLRLYDAPEGWIVDSITTVGEPGPGLAPGGTEGQYPRRVGPTSFTTEWANLSDNVLPGFRMKSRAGSTPGSMYLDYAGSAIYRGSWTFEEGTAPPPATQSIKVNALTLKNVTEIYVDNTTLEGTDIVPALGNLTPGDLLIFEDETAAVTHVYRLTDIPVDQGAYTRIPVVSQAGPSINPVAGDIIELTWVPQAIEDFTDLGLIVFSTTIYSAYFEAAVGRNYGFSSASGSFSILMPPNPTPGQQVGFADVGGVAGSFPVTLLRNGELFNGVADDFVHDISLLNVVFWYTGPAKGWLVAQNNGAV